MPQVGPGNPGEDTKEGRLVWVLRVLISVDADWITGKEENLLEDNVQGI